MMPSCDQIGVPIHFHSSTTSGSASLMSLRILPRVSPRQSPSSTILFEMSSEADWPWLAPDFFMFSSWKFQINFIIHQDSGSERAFGVLQSAAQLPEFKFLAVLRHFNLPTKSVVNVTGHSLRSVGLAVRDENALGRGRHSFQPANRFFPIGVRRKAANLFD